MIQRFRQDDGLSEVSGGLAAALAGDIVVYYNDGRPEHIGIIAHISQNSFGKLDAMVISKWGDAGEYLHWIDDVPAAYGTEKRIITDRK